MNSENPVQSKKQSSAQVSSEVKLGRIAAGIPVRDIALSVRFYTENLGLKKVFENGDPVGFVILESGPAELHLTLVKEHRPSDRNLAHVMVNDATALYDRLVENKVRIIKGLRDAEYGLRGFVFADPDGNRIDVGQEL